MKINYLRSDLYCDLSCEKERNHDILFYIYIYLKKTLAAYAPHKLKHRCSFEETFLPSPIHIQSHKINLPINRKNRTIDNFVIYDTMGK